MRASNKLGRWRWLVLVTMFAMVAAACQSGGGDTTTTAAGGGDTTTTAASGGDTTTTAAGGAATEGFTYRLGIFQDTTTDNFWAYLDPASTVWNAYVLTPTKPTLYQDQLSGTRTRC